MIGLVTLYHPNYQRLADLVLPNMREYCDRHGYTLFAHCGEYGPGQIGFQKMRYLRALLDQGLELALVTDLDIVITNLDKRFEDFMEGDTVNSYFVTKDVNGINNGSFIIRNTEWVKYLIDFMLENMGSFTCEQNVLKELEAQLVGKGVKILPHPSINSYLHEIYPEWRGVPFPNDWKEGNFLLHLPGMELDKRLMILNGMKRGEVFK